jgi:hypothetical protein
MGADESTLIHEQLSIDATGKYLKVDNDTCLPCDRIKEILKTIKVTDLNDDLMQTINEFCGDEPIDGTNVITNTIHNKIYDEHVISTNELILRMDDVSMQTKAINLFPKKPNESEGTIKVNSFKNGTRVHVNDQWCMPCSAFSDVRESHLRNLMRKECES